MDRNLISRTPCLILALFLLASLLPQAGWIARPLDTMITQTLYEDAFYYFQVSYNVAQGKGSLAAGGIPSNGYHPLWMLLCAGFFRAVPDSAAAIRCICVFGVALSIAASIFVFLALRGMRCGSWAAVCGALVFHWNPWMMSLSISGLEAPLNALLLAASIWWLTRQNRLPGWFAGLGALAGLAYLTRTDNVFFCAALFALAAWKARKDARVLWGGMALASTLALLIVLPWHVWNFARFGQFMQGSASALPVVRELVYFNQHPGATRADFMLHRLALLGGWFLAAVWFSGLGSLWGLLGVVAGAIFIRRRGWKNLPASLENLTPLLPLAVAVLFLGIAHKFFRLASREWYFVTSDVLLALAWGGAAQYLLDSARVFPKGVRSLRALAILVAFVLPVLMLGMKTAKNWQARQAGPRAYPLEILDAFGKIKEVQPGEPFGSTDSGILGFLSPRPFINLDGVVNPEAGRAVRNGVLLDYMQSKGIRYAIITKRMMNARILGPDFASRLRQRPELTPEGYELIPPAPKPE